MSARMRELRSESFEFRRESFSILTRSGQAKTRVARELMTVDWVYITARIAKGQGTI